MVEGNSLENCRTARYREFESHLLRSQIKSCQPEADHPLGEKLSYRKVPPAGGVSSNLTSSAEKR